MSAGENTIDSRQMLSRLARERAHKNSETAVVTSPGARVAAWAIRVISHNSYNVYNVRMLQMGPPGTLPAAMGQNMQATNMAEPFLQQGQLPDGSYAIMFRVGDKNVFYAPVQE
jgi:hypothetical protein